jgi:hypothetical protein
MLPMRSFLPATAALAMSGLVAALIVITPAESASAKKPNRPAATCRIQTYHEEVRVGTKCCFVDHFHYGSGDTQSTKEQAMASAGRAWSDFVNFEYGSAYDNFGLAVSKSFNCSGGGRQWSCSVEAIACQPN